MNRGIIGVIIGVLVIIILVIVILQLTCFRSNGEFSTFSSVQNCL